MWAEGDLNPHALRRLLLRQVRLPFRHPPVFAKEKPEQKESRSGFSLACPPCRDRTYDLILKRDLLYQLS